MSLLCRRLLDQQTLTNGSTLDLADAVDLGGSTVLELVLTVHTAAAGESPTLTLEHAAVNEAGAYLAFDEPATFDLTATGLQWRHRVAFTRFLRWTTSGTFASDAVVTLDLVAKG